MVDSACPQLRDNDNLSYNMSVRLTVCQVQ
jgi:hypothetical protein